ncbi:MAG TPA: alpha-L-rhamnosidase C-terminal domain-containing protein [Armatimonadota bacterium]|jgi:hypothetical protein
MASTPPEGAKASWIWTAVAKDSQKVALRKSFDVKAAPERALLYVTADNYFTAYVNGQRVGGSEPKSGDDLVWRQVQRLDVTRAVKTGANTLAIEGRNDGGAAGVIALLSLRTGKSVEEVVTDSTWIASEGAPEGWEQPSFAAAWGPATEEAPLGGGAWTASGGLVGWPGLQPFASHLSRTPVAIRQVLQVDPGDGTIRGAASLTRMGRASLVVAPPTGPVGSNRPPGLVVDFGREITGRVQVDVEQGGGTLLLSYGESLGEALEKPYNGVQRIPLSAGESALGQNSAYRYAKLVFTDLAQPMRIRSIHCDHIYYPVTYRGSFDCSDPLLTQLWYTGAYTAHLCMQDDIWDAPKRDRWRWMGDLQVEGLVISNAFLDRHLMELTMDHLRADCGKPIKSHVNGIPGYSCAWVVGLSDYYMHTGALDYIKRHHDDLIELLDYFQGELDDRGVFANKRRQWTFVDWSQDFNGTTPAANRATHFFMTLMLKRGAWLLREMGDVPAAARYDAWAKRSEEAAQKYLLDPGTTFAAVPWARDRWQDNSMAVYSGIATLSQRQQIWQDVLSRMYPEKLFMTPYYLFYSISAMGMADRVPEALRFIRYFWGDMLKQGATTTWEGYDPRWPKEHFHRSLQADNGMGYFVSLCHGWSAGPTAWLTQYVLGVKPTSPGFRTVEIRPNLAGLKWAKGDVPTPHGAIHVVYRRAGMGVKAEIQVPPGVKATVVSAGYRDKPLKVGRNYLNLPG